jgi:hypothetical protein
MKDSKISGSHSPLGKLAVEKQITQTNKGINSEREWGIKVPSSPNRRTLEPKRMGGK